MTAKLFQVVVPVGGLHSLRLKTLRPGEQKTLLLSVLRLFVGKAPTAMVGCIGVKTLRRQVLIKISTFLAVAPSRIRCPQGQLLIHLPQTNKQTNNKHTQTRLCVATSLSAKSTVLSTVRGCTATDVQQYCFVDQSFAFAQFVGFHHSCF